MIDDLFDRAYRDGRAELNAGLDHALAQFARTVGDGLRALHRLEWHAPWQSRSNGPQVH